jgi:hypothetical protein
MEDLNEVQLTCKDLQAGQFNRYSVRTIVYFDFMFWFGLKELLL